MHFISSGAPPDDEDFDGSGSGLGLPDLWEDLTGEDGSEEEEEDGTDGGRVPVSCTHPGRGRPVGEEHLPTTHRQVRRRYTRTGLGE